MATVNEKYIFEVEVKDSCVYDSVDDVVSSSVTTVFSSKWIEVLDKDSLLV